MNDVTAAMPDAPDGGKPPAEPKAKVNLGSLRMIARFTLDYPRQILFALLALVVAASSTLAIPYGLRLIIDKGFI
ncbi:MAG: hypothetical protein ACK473_10850, partial [Sphingomonadales bacterium]